MTGSLSQDVHGVEESEVLRTDLEVRPRWSDRIQSATTRCTVDRGTCGKSWGRTFGDRAASGAKLQEMAAQECKTGQQALKIELPPCMQHVEAPRTLHVLATRDSSLMPKTSYRIISAQWCTSPQRRWTSIALKHYDVIVLCG